MLQNTLPVAATTQSRKEELEDAVNQEQREMFMLDLFISDKDYQESQWKAKLAKCQTRTELVNTWLFWVPYLH